MTHRKGDLCQEKPIPCAHGHLRKVVINHKCPCQDHNRKLACVMSMACRDRNSPVYLHMEHLHSDRKLNNAKLHCMVLEDQNGSLLEQPTHLYRPLELLRRRISPRKLEWKVDHHSTIVPPCLA